MKKDKTFKENLNKCRKCNRNYMLQCIDVVINTEGAANIIQCQYCGQKYIKQYVFSYWEKL